MADYAPAIPGMQLWRSTEVATTTGWQPLGHPEFTLVARDGDTVSRLRGEFSSDQMDEDIALDRAGNGRALTLWTAKDAWNRIVWLTLITCAIATWSLAFLVVISLPGRKTVVVLSLVALVASVGFLTVARLGMPIVEGETQRGDYFEYAHYYAEGLDKQKEWSSKQEILDELRKAGAPQESDTPNGYTVVESDTSFEVVTYDNVAYPQTPIILKKKLD